MEGRDNMKKAITILFFAVTFGQVLQAQEDLVLIDASTHGTTVSMEAMGGSITLQDDNTQGTSGNPMYGVDYYITIVGNCEDENRLTFYLGDFSVSCIDTLYFYDGADTNAPLITKINNFYGDVHQGDYIFIGPTNNTNTVTVRFRTGDITNTTLTNLDCYRNNNGVGHGFSMSVHCRKPCESVTPVIEEKFYRTRNGVIYDSAYTRMVTQIDTSWVDDDDHSLGIDHFDTLQFIGAHLCIGDGVIFKGHGVYSHKYHYYEPSDATSYFTWDMANDGDTIQGVGMTSAAYADYQKTGCYDMVLDIKDVYGCGTDLLTSIKIRTSANPIKTIFTLADICNRDSLMVNMGYSGENATLTLREIENNESVSKTYECVTFIPDYCGCTPPYFEAPVEFSEFSNAGRINNASDICSVCINMEHTWIGDIYITLVCPTGQETMFKFGNPSCGTPAGLPASSTENGGGHGSNINLGWPTHQDGAICPTYEPWGSPYGIGLDYCFSRNNAYTLITGQSAGSVWSPTNLHPAGDFYIVTTANNQNTINTNDPEYGLEALLGPGTTQLPHCPDYVDAMGVSHPFPAGDYNVDGTTSRRPSKHEDKEDYYLPYSDFSELIGCPLNGTWKVRVYDTWGGDNGWIFNWSMDICGVSMDDDCKYTVGIDSLIWRPNPDPQYHDYDLGHYRGLKVDQASPTVSYILSPDTAGTFPIDVLIYDEFGCIWDTTTRITTYWTPEPHLGDDFALCGVDQAILDATDRHTATENYTYIWEPYGQNTSTIETQYEPGGDVRYVVGVFNTRGQLVCETHDTIDVSLRTQPLPNFAPIPFTFEGCDPMTLTFDNRSIDAVRYFWDFGDGITSELENPTHTYAEGIYTLKYYAYSDDGCVDSVISERGVAVYPTPQASFSWNPVYPSVLNPVVNFINNTTPDLPSNNYFWEVQYNRDNPLSVETMTSHNATFDFSQYSNGDVSGVYGVRLIARTDNLAPSGNMIYCSDTAANSVLVINDFLQFPNVVTPNGDGINDRFVIQNLIDGLGYPINTLDIYNKWGTRVFHKENISSDDDFWDPVNVPAGTYFYRFSAQGYNGNIEHNGAIEVIK
jgi:gliding motility-associated-like protein